jgi:hypothetical protein
MLNLKKIKLYFIDLNQLKFLESNFELKQIFKLFYSKKLHLYLNFLT